MSTVVAEEASSGLAYRGNGTDRPFAVRGCPSTGPLVQGGRLRKYWRYVGVWGTTISICAARVRVGPLTQEFWAVWDRDSGILRQRTRMSAGRVHIGADRLVVLDGEVSIDLDLRPAQESAVEVVSPVERAWTWTRKLSTRAVGEVRIGARRHRIDAAAMVEQNGGYHPRRTHWWWTAGAGTLTDGRSAMWNAVVGLNDRGPHHENTIWIDGVPQQTSLVQISPDLATTRFDSGEALHFTSEVERSMTTNLVVLRSQYRAPFGTFTGTLPGGLQLADGHGVMEDHSALW